MSSNCRSKQSGVFDGIAHGIETLTESPLKHATVRLRQDTTQQFSDQQFPSHIEVSSDAGTCRSANLNATIPNDRFTRDPSCE
ncbi:MAG TPA: hypothetical protein DDZ51_20160 [Planctomycetaceae bacterium]|nr:hypothetical protein [Planctomycetaceae bacterium]